jgi:cytochrome bd-type quinol oxidase subunit 1
MLAFLGLSVLFAGLVAGAAGWAVRDVGRDDRPR